MAVVVPCSAVAVTAAAAWCLCGLSAAGNPCSLKELLITAEGLQSIEVWSQDNWTS